MIVMGKETFLAPEIMFQVNMKWVECLPAICSNRMCSWGPIFAYVLISEMSVWMDTEVAGYVKGSG